MIGFGQMDKLIFSSGDTIIGKVIEVGLYDVTYQHKDETTNNLTKKRELAKVIYSSGRIETFQGLGILESKIERQENDKLYQQQKEERNKIRIQKRNEVKLIQRNYKKSFEIGVIFGASFNNNTATADYEKNKHITTIEGLILKYNSNSNYTISLQINYHITGYSIQDPWSQLTFGDMIDPQYGFIYPTIEETPNTSYIKLSNHYILMPIAIEYSFYTKPKFIIKAGAYSSYLIKSISEWEAITSGEDIQTQNMKQYDYGAVFGIGLSYPINNQFNLLFDCTAYYGLEDYLNTDYFFPYSSSSKNRTATAIIGLTYNLKKK